MKCRPGCGACCIAQSISSPIPGMPADEASADGASVGKPAGARCIHLTDDYCCRLYGDPRRPQVCVDFQAMPDVCGSSREEALRLLGEMERETAPQADDR